MYNAYVKAINNNIEEEVTIVVEGFELVGFANYVPYTIEVGKTYPVSIGITVLDELKLDETILTDKGFQRIGTGFAHFIRGILKPGGIIDGGIEIQDDLLIDCAYLYEKFVEIRVDRISISFEKIV